MEAPEGHTHVAHAPAAFGPLPGRRTNAGLPADLGAAGPQWMTERAKLGLVFENRYWHANDHAPAGGVSVLRVGGRGLLVGGGLCGPLPDLTHGGGGACGLAERPGLLGPDPGGLGTPLDAAA